MNEAEKLAERLRTRNGSPTGFGLGPVCDEAASLIERQAEQIKVLQLQLLAAANYVDALGGDSKSYRSALAATKEET